MEPVRDPEPLDVGPEVGFADVPDAGPDVPLDPHWLDLRGGSVLPAVYMPPAMAGLAPRAPWLRTVAVVLVAMFLTATAAGVCLTYGPPHVWP
jgi:hypothetical protein